MLRSTLSAGPHEPSSTRAAGRVGPNVLPDGPLTARRLGLPCRKPNRGRRRCRQRGRLGPERLDHPRWRSECEGLHLPRGARRVGDLSHGLDQHPYRKLRRLDREPEQLLAGDWLHWHHNTMILKGPRTTPRTTIGAKIRGTPQSLAKVHHNWFRTENVRQAIGPYGGTGGSGVGNGNIWVWENAYGPRKRGLTRIPARTTPQILMKTPPPPELKPHPVAGKPALEVEIHTLAPLKLAGTAVKLDGRVLWLEPRAPKPGEVVIDTARMGKGEPGGGRVVHLYDAYGRRSAWGRGTHYGRYEANRPDVCTKEADRPLRTTASRLYSVT